MDVTNSETVCLRFLRYLLFNKFESEVISMCRTSSRRAKILTVSNTDTALLEFSGRPVNETREISENIYVDLDKDGNLVSMTIEHAQQAASLPSVVIEEFGQAVA